MKKLKIIPIEFEFNYIENKILRSNQPNVTYFNANNRINKNLILRDLFSSLKSLEEKTSSHGLNRHLIGKKYNNLSINPLFDDIFSISFSSTPNKFYNSDFNIFNEMKINLGKLIGQDIEVVDSKNYQGLNFDYILNEKRYSLKELPIEISSVIILVLNMIEDLYDENNKNENLSDLKGNVIIENIELHLDFYLQTTIMRNLQSLFPNIHFYVSTSSPSVLMGASKTDFIYNLIEEINDSNNILFHQIKYKNINDFSYNMMVTSPLFILNETKNIKDFNKESTNGSDDYIYSLIHKSVRENIQENPLVLNENMKSEIKRKLKEIREK